MLDAAHCSLRELGQSEFSPNHPTAQCGPQQRHAPPPRQQGAAAIPPLSGAGGALIAASSSAREPPPWRATADGCGKVAARSSDSSVSPARAAPEPPASSVGGHRFCVADRSFLVRLQNGSLLSVPHDHLPLIITCANPAPHFPHSAGRTHNAQCCTLLSERAQSIALGRRTMHNAAHTIDL